MRVDLQPAFLPALGRTYSDAFAELPLLLLQAAAIVGMVSILLLVKRDVPLDHQRYKIRFGLVFGVTGFIVTMLVSEYIQTPSKPYLRADSLFLAGLLGGWAGGLISLTFAALARLIFGGWHLFPVAMLDLSIITLGGIALHRWFSQRDRSRLGWREFAICFAVRMAVVISGIVLLYGLDLVSTALYESNLARRLTSVVITLPLMGAIFVLLRSDAATRDALSRRETVVVTDTLTGLPNRRALRDYIEASDRDATPGAERTLVLFEVVNMPELFSVYGDHWPDSFWPRLADDLRDGPIGAELSGHQPRCFLFADTTLAVVLQSASAQALEDAGRLGRLHGELTALWQARSDEGQPVPQLRIGAASLTPSSAYSLASRLRNISLALQQSDNPVQTFPHSFAEKAQADEGVRRMLVEWIRRVDPPLHYQPKFALADGRICGAEALLRAVDADGRTLPPPYVLEIAERHRLLVGLEWATVDVVVRDLQRIGPALNDVGLAVNVSAVSFVSAGFGERVLELLAERNVAPERLSIEVTETGKVPSIDIVQQNVEILSRAGVKLSLDDFGNGYSALTLLARYPFAEVKIDRWMTASLGQSRIRQAIALVVESARRYGARLVIEGIESDEQRRSLLEMGVQWGQGYLCSPAVPWSVLIALCTQAGRDEAHLAGATD